MGCLFGTDGIRGRANQDPMTAQMALRVGQGVAYMLRGLPRRPRVLIGKDTRVSGYMLEYALVAGVCSMGADAFLVGPLPTPGIAFLTVDMRADAGLVISASHNPYPDNGIKIFASDGFKLSDELEGRIEQAVLAEELPLPEPAHIGKAHRIDDAAGRYVVFLKRTFPQELTLDGVRMVLDCAHGAAYRVAPTVFEELGAEVILLGAEPDGLNINQDCGSLHPQAMSETVRRYRADLGVSLDGDGDRAIFADERGQVLNGDHIMAICALDMKRRGILRGDAVVATVMSNLALDLCLREAGIQVVRAPVGDRYVVERMRQGGYNLGGEQSGHLVFLDHNTTGDGILTTLQLLAIMIRGQRPLSELASVLQPFPQVNLSVPVANRQVAGHPAVQQLVTELEAQLDGRGRVLVRPSGTESVVRVTVEGQDLDQVEAMAQQIAQRLQEEDQAHA